MSKIDINFDFRTDTPKGKDPDAFSPTLRSYHKIMWSKPLPSGETLDLDDSRDNAYLYHQSKLGNFLFSSDSAIQSFSRWKSMSQLIKQLGDDEVEGFVRQSYTMGAMIIFPANRIDGKMTINGARGFNPLIKDRIDLTLECIKRHYDDEPSPLAEVLKRHSDFFALFSDFEGYVKFFLLQDLVSEDFSNINFFMPFGDFKTPAVPRTLDSYHSYKDLNINFIKLRNLRIRANY